MKNLDVSFLGNLNMVLRHMNAIIIDIKKIILYELLKRILEIDTIIATNHSKGFCGSADIPVPMDTQ